MSLDPRGPRFDSLGDLLISGGPTDVVIAYVERLPMRRLLCGEGAHVAAE